MILIAHIIPILRLTPNLGVFDYIVPDVWKSQISLYQLVQIPFRKQNVLGIVVYVGNKTSFDPKKLKPIIGPYQPTIILPESFVKIIRQTAQKYYCSPALLFKTALPSFPKRGFEHASKNSISDTSVTKPHLILFQKKQDAISDLKNRLSHTKGIRVILVPFVSMIQEIRKALQITEPTAFIHKQQTPKEYREEWMKIFSGEVSLIIGTRLACFVPVSNATFFLWQEDQLDFKQYDQNPRYDARLVLQYWNHYYGSPLYLYSHCPRVQTFYKTTQNYTLTTLPTYPLPEPIMVPMAQEEKQHKKHLVSFSLQEALRDCFPKHALLWLNRLGNEQILFCVDCKYLLSCPDCHVTLRLKKETLTCGVCNKIVPIPTNCPNCQGPTLLALGTGIQKVADYLQKLFPDTPVFCIESQTAFPTLTKPSILVGTDYLFHHNLPQNIGLFAALDITPKNHIYDIASQEHWFSQLLKFLYLACEQEATCLLQSFQENIPSLELVLLNQRENFLQQELTWRKQVHLPPFGKLMKIICKDANEHQFEQHIKDLLKSLTIINKCDIIKILGTYRIKRTKTQIQSALILKQLQPDIMLKIPPLPPDYQIDIDYETVY